MELIEHRGLDVSVRLTKREFDFLESLLDTWGDDISEDIMAFMRERVQQAIDEHEWAMGEDECDCSWCAGTYADVPAQ